MISLFLVQQIAQHQAAESDSSERRQSLLPFALSSVTKADSPRASLEASNKNATSSSWHYYQDQEATSNKGITTGSISWTVSISCPDVSSIYLDALSSTALRSKSVRCFQFLQSSFLELRVVLIAFQSKLGALMLLFVFLGIFFWVLTMRGLNSWTFVVC